MAKYHAGRVQTVVFENDAQSFYVVKMKLEGRKTDGGMVTVRGHVPGLEVKEGTWFGFEGKWENHQTYGRQLVISRAPVVKTWDAETILKLLQGHGVGARVCSAMSEHFGDDLSDVLGDSERLQEVGCISEFTAHYIVSRWQAVRSMFQSLRFLGDLKLPKTKVQRIYSHFGDDAESTLSENPWALVEIDGISFEQADEVALRLGLDMTCIGRLRGAVLHTCKVRRGMGHLYLNSGEIVQGVHQYAPETDRQTIAETLKGLHDEELLTLDNQTRKDTTAIYEPWFHEIERECAKLLSARTEQASFEDQRLTGYLEELVSVGPETKAVAETEGSTLAEVAKTAIGEWSSHGEVRLSDAQLEGAVNALVEPVSIVTGLPGTGKTTLLRIVVKVLQDANVPFLLVAPTGIAAKRITALTGAEASTIHRALGARGARAEDGRESTYAGIVGDSNASIDSDGSEEYWSFSTMRPHPTRVVIVDESSMMDQHLLYRLLSCTTSECRLCFVGDAAQLPSVGPGNVLRDLIASGRFPVVDLREIFRQDEASDIVIAAHAINGGSVPTFSGGSKDFTFIEVREEARVLETVVATVEKLYARRANFQVLSPRHKGTLGVTNLNLRIRELLNPKTPGLREMRLGSETVREGDRVMVSKNNYRYEIFNGDVGKVTRLDEKAKSVAVKIHGPPVMQVQMPFRDAPEHLRLAYCVTIHKSQGQEYDVILMPWVSGFHHQLQRNLIYTAITRARKKVILVGHPEALEKAVRNSKIDTRNTLFPDRLQAFLASCNETP